MPFRISSEIKYKLLQPHGINYYLTWCIVIPGIFDIVEILVSVFLLLFATWSSKDCPQTKIPLCLLVSLIFWLVSSIKRWIIKTLSLLRFSLFTLTMLIFIVCWKKDATFYDNADNSKLLLLHVDKNIVYYIIIDTKTLNYCYPPNNTTYLM